MPEATRRDLEDTRREFEAQLAAVDIRTIREGSVNAGTSAYRVKPPKFDGPASWEVFHHQFETAVDHKWTS
jgi:hypothetical protein